MLPDDDRGPPYVFGRGPDYAIVGGLVFQGLTGPTWEPGALGPPGPASPPDRDDRDGRAAPAAPLVLLSSVLPDAANLGYQDLRDLIVER